MSITSSSLLAADTWVGPYEIESIVVRPDIDGFYIRGTASAACGQNTLYGIDPTLINSEYGKRVFSSVSLALAAGKKVYLRVKDCSSPHPYYFTVMTVVGIQVDN